MTTVDFVLYVLAGILVFPVFLPLAIIVFLYKKWKDAE